MTRICAECGSEIPEGSSFCYHCGRDAKDAYDIEDPGQGTYSSRVCDSGCQTCSSCGPGPYSQSIVIRPRLVKNAWIGIILAVVPGFFNIFGLGHIFYRKWGRGLMYLVISVPLFYLEYMVRLDPISNSLIFLCTLAIYFVQALEVLSLSITTDIGEK